MKDKLLNIVKHIARDDVVCLLGLVFIGIGLWWLQPWISLTVVGSLLFCLSVFPGIALMLRRKDR